MRILATVILLLLSGSLYAQEPPPPVIDMHLHAVPIAFFEQLAGPAPVPHCVPMTDYPVPESARQWPEVFRSRDLPCRALQSGSTDMAIESIESADFLTGEQKRDIFFNNAARFLRLSQQQVAAMHGKPSS